MEKFIDIISWTLAYIIVGATLLFEVLHHPVSFALWYRRYLAHTFAKVAFDVWFCNAVRRMLDEQTSQVR